MALTKLSAAFHLVSGPATKVLSFALIDAFVETTVIKQSISASDYTTYVGAAKPTATDFKASATDKDGNDSSVTVDLSKSNFCAYCYLSFSSFKPLSAQNFRVVISFWRLFKNYEL
ncbi:hypothetical protein [Lacticaseibacillus paracasei]